MQRSTTWAWVCLLAILLVAGSAQARAATPVRQVATGHVQTANFEVYAAAPIVASFASLAEECRQALVERWLSAGSVAEQWQPRCVLVIHASQQAYEKAVGQPGIRSRGSSLVEFQRDRVGSRRIDLWATDRQTATEALPHELVHILLAESFTRQTMPRWANEGLAILADPPARQLAHDGNFRGALAEGRHFGLERLLAVNAYPTGPACSVYYGQSRSLVQFLLKREPVTVFVAFLRTAGERGYDEALRQHYQIDGIAPLEQLWHDAIEGGGELADDHIVTHALRHIQG